MVKRTLEVYECDVCGAEGKRYSIVYDEGTFVMDRCERHAKKLESFKEEPGEWQQPGVRTTFRKSSPAELRLAVARARHNGGE